MTIDIIDADTAIQIHEWDKKLIAVEQIRDLVLDEMGKLIEPLLDQNSLEVDKELLEILQAPGYWQFEVRCRIRALKKLRAGSSPMTIPTGYHQRLSGSMVTTYDPVKNPLFCDLCKRPATHLTGYEREYPKYPDLSVCPICELETSIKERK